jgi:two-component system cell cycle sensor histidine kinase/response regulator CckA
VERKAAEARLKEIEKRLEGKVPIDSPEWNTQEALHELRVHQIELEMQNDELEHSQRNLEESAKRYQNLYEGAPVGYITCAPDGRILHANQMAGTILGTKASTLTSKFLPSFSARECRDDLHLLFKRLARQSEVQDCELRFAVAQDDVRDVRVDARAEYDQDGKVHQVLVCISDVTARKQAEAQVQSERARHQADQLRIAKLESLGVLAGGIAHNFNNLLTGVLANLSFARTMVKIRGLVKEDDEFLTLLGDAESAATRATSLTAQLLTFAKGGAPVRKVLSVRKLLEETVQFTLRGSAVHCDVELADALWAASADHGQLGQVIQNLVINSAHSMPNGGVMQMRATNEVLEEDAIATLPAGDYVKIVVKDRGCGISEEHLAQIFDPYFTTRHLGSGLGLATSHSIVAQHKGTISVSSIVGKGTTMIVYLPALRDAVLDEDSGSLAPVATGSARVLFMDDEPMIRKIAHRTLSSVGYEVVVASDGRAAIDRFEEGLAAGLPFDVVILDLTIPGGMGGLETLRELRRISPGVRAIVSSGYADDAVLANFREFGFVTAAPKPYRAATLPKAVEEALKSTPLA